MAIKDKEAAFDSAEADVDQRDNSDVDQSRRDTAVEDDSPSQDVVDTDSSSDVNVDSEDEHTFPSARKTEQSKPDDDNYINWSASEFMSHEKSANWFVIVAVVGLVIAILAYVATKAILPTLTAIVGTIMFSVYGARDPRELEYQIDKTGLTIGPKHFSYDHFRSFSIIKEGALRSIDFMPLKRFSPMISVYFHPDDEHIIAEILGNYLPHEDREQDMVERLMHHIRF